MVDLWCLGSFTSSELLKVYSIHYSKPSNYHFTYLDSCFMFFNLFVSIRSTRTKVQTASVKSLLNPGACGFIKAFLYKKKHVKNKLTKTLTKITKIC